MCRREGFTLLELLVVVAIIAIVAGGVVVMLDDVEESAARQVGDSEIVEIWKAVRRFRDDTGFLPKQGPFNLKTRGGHVSPPPQGEVWFDSPANFMQLYENPLAGTGHPLERWNPDARRGWHGPYLSQHGEGFVDVGAGLLADGSGSPAAGKVLPGMRGVADPFLAPPAGDYLVWRNTLRGPPQTQKGRPYLLLGLNLTDPNLLREHARIVGMGPNRTYESDAQTIRGDDVVIYLFK